MCQIKFIIWTCLVPVESAVKVPMRRHVVRSYTGVGIVVVEVGTMTTMTMTMSGSGP